MIQIFRNPNVNFIKLRFFAYVISAIMVAAGIVGIVNIVRGTANLGIDFSGGTIVTVKFVKEVDIAQIRQILDANGLKEAGIQTFAEATGLPKNKVSIRMKKSGEKTGEIGDKIEKMFAEKYPVIPQYSVEKAEQVKADVVFTLLFVNKVEAFKVKNLVDKSLTVTSSEEKDGKVILKIKRPGAKIDELQAKVKALLDRDLPAKRAFTRDSTEDIGPALSKKLTGQAVFAVIISLLAITLYILIRFDSKIAGRGLFGVSAAVATLHDILALVGFVYLMNIEFSILIMTSILTIAGYSLTDTVVVFDRIRDNLKLRAKDEFGVIINASVNEVLSRTIMTSVTVLIAALSLWIFGGEVLHKFSEVLLFGVVLGTYSSWFVASPILYEYEKNHSRNLPVKK